MSGTYVTRVNRQYTLGATYGRAIYAYFWELLNLFNDLGSSRYEFVSYGIGASVSGSGAPTSWIAWDPTSADVPPFTANAWFVIRALNADYKLNSGGGRPWEAKFQVVNDLADAFDDCSGNDYGQEGETEVVCCRLSPDGGWSDVSRDFAPASGADVSDNYPLIDERDENWRVHLFADDDTVLSIGMVGSAVNYDRARFFYLGEVIQSHESVVKPEVLIACRMSTLSAGVGSNRQVLGGRGDVGYVFPGVGVRVDFETAHSIDFFALSATDQTTGVTGVVTYAAGAWWYDGDDLPRDEAWDSEPMLSQILLRLHAGIDNYDPFGALRFLEMGAINQANGSEYKDATSNYLVFSAYQGIWPQTIVKWPDGETPDF